MVSRDLRRSAAYRDLPKQIQYRVSYNLGTYSPTTFGPTKTNERIALQARILKATPPMDVGRMLQLRNFVFANFSTIFPNMRNIKPDTIEVYLRNTNASPTVKKAIAAARSLLSDRGINEQSGLSSKDSARYCQVKAFVKVENNLYHSRHNLLKAPRIISSMPPEFVALTGPWHSAVQRKLMRTWNKDFPIMFSSGMSTVDICKRLFKPNRRILEDDVSSFDSSISSSMLQLECEIFRRFGAPRTVLQLMRDCVKTRGRSKHYKYSRPGGRKSGVPYTSSGNTILNGLMHLFLYAEANNALGRKAFKRMFKKENCIDMVAQGDDNLLTFDEPLFPIDWKRGMSQFGFKADAIPRSRPMDAEFCSCHVVPFAEGYNLVPKLGRIVNKFGYFCDPPLHEKPTALLRAVAIGGLSNTAGSPFLKQFYQTMLDHIPNHPLSGRYHKFFRFKEWSMKVEQLTPSEATASFYYNKYYLTQHTFGLILRTLAAGLGRPHRVSEIVQLLIDRDTAAPKWIYN